MASVRLDRQLRIPEWRQEVLSRARLGVVGDDAQLTSLFLLSAAALGINEVRVIAPCLDERLLGLARSLNPDWRLQYLRGYLTHPLCLEALRQCHPLVDLSHFSLASKILLEAAFQHRLTVVRGRRWQDAQVNGLAVLTYQRGREWRDLQEVLAGQQLPGGRAPHLDGVLDIVAAGIMLEEVKTILMAGGSSAELLVYTGPGWTGTAQQPAIGIVGAGALGNFVGLGLAMAGFRQMTFIDPDVIEVTNLNRQIFFGGAVGAGKAQTLAARLRQDFDLPAQYQADYFHEEDVSRFALIFDCVDNFASRIAISEACADRGIPLISGGADVARGQVVAYHPLLQPQPPAALLNMYGVQHRRDQEEWRRTQAACIYQPNPAVIMTNQVIAGFMVEAARHLLAGRPWPPLWYDAAAPHKLGRA
ncbi:MAG: ThiF family adenylyltransferase [Desulfobacca sp.]|uniref:ThiF family adenylyltransferase n=1 Tax=Desulfobacca sp. TaxID=2067990 RepID=UPI0040497992